MQLDVTDRPALRRRLDQAWERFLRDGELDGVRPAIARSWRRARELYRVDPALTRAPSVAGDELTRRQEQDEALDLARPVLAGAAARLREAGHVVTFVDADGIVLSLGGDPATAARLEEINLRPGARWREEVTGTSGAGTALADRLPVEVFASEHFVRAWQPWASVAAPVVSPGSGEVAAVIQLTGAWDAGEPPGLLAAVALAAAVEERLRARLAVRDELLRHALRAARSTGEAVVAVDAAGRVLDASEGARRRLVLERDQLPPAVRDRLLAALRGEGWRDGDVWVEWPGAGEERRRVAAAVIAHEGRPAGAILHVRQAPAGPGRPGRRRLAARYGFEAILGPSERLRDALDLAEIAARNDLPVVLHGESGTGKELFGQGIHTGGDRAAGPFVALNCGAIPAALVESELFGYEPGTFTGAQREGKAGKFEEADGGTLFLDEVSELPAQAQTALLRVLQEGEVVRLGGSTPRRIDVRVVAATNRRLRDEVEAGRFRQDLYFRLNVLHVDIPPLRSRPEDVPVLAEAFLREAEARLGREALSFSKEAVAELAAHPWPGNVRELRNVVLRAAAVAPGPTIEAGDLRLTRIGGAAPARAAAQPEPRPAEAGPQGAGEGDGAERAELIAALDAGGWNIARTATSLGVSRMTLYRRLRKYGITR